MNEQVEALLAEAKGLLNYLLKVPGGFNNKNAEQRFIDCIISAAVLEATAIKWDL